VLRVQVYCRQCGQNSRQSTLMRETHFAPPNPAYVSSSENKPASNYPVASADR
jgi:hypothetical protein